MNETYFNQYILLGRCFEKKTRLIPFDTLNRLIILFIHIVVKVE